MRKMTPQQLSAERALAARFGRIERQAIERGTGDLLLHVYPRGEASARLYRIAPDGTTKGV